MSKITKGEITVSVDKIVSLEREISSKDQTIGVQQERIKNLEKEKENKEWDINANHKKELNTLKEKLEKEVKIVEGDAAYKEIRCPDCGYYHDVYTGSTPKITWKGLDDVVDMIRKEESKKLKVDVNKLEDEKETLEYNIDKVRKELSRVRKEQNDAITEAKTRTRDRYNKMLDESERRYNKLEEEKTEIIAQLKEEIQKIQDDKTDQQIEEARKQEIINLKVAIDEYKKDKENMLNMLPKFLRKRFENQKLAEKALENVTEREELVEKISNNYPEVKRRRKVWGELKTRLDRAKKASWVEFFSTGATYDYYEAPKYNGVSKF